MSRSAVKSISRVPEKLIPSSHASDPSLNEDAPDIKDRPLVFYVRKMSRDEQFKVRELIEFKDDLKPEKGLKGSGDVAKYIWENNVTEVRNVLIMENGNPVTYESVVGQQKNDLWNTEGMDMEINEAILFARNISVLEDSEAKN
jgi:hypothetical protein